MTISDAMESPGNWVLNSTKTCAERYRSCSLFTEFDTIYFHVGWNNYVIEREIKTGPVWKYSGTAPASLSLLAEAGIDPNRRKLMHDSSTLSRNRY